MYLRCPYCRHELVTPPKGFCPHCGKGVMVPQHLRPTTFRERKRAKERIRRAADRERRAIGITPDVRRKPVQLLFVLAGLAIVGFLVVARARRGPPPPGPVSLDLRAQEEVNVLRAALERYRDDCDRYPADKPGLTALISNPGEPNWFGPYVTVVRSDPWDTPFVYEVGPTGVVVLSSGADATRGTVDDVTPGDWQPLLATP